MNVIGRRRVSFKPKDVDKAVDGWRLYLVMEDPKVEGTACDSIFVTDEKILNGVVPNVKDKVFVTYNKYGKIEYVQVI